MEAARVVTVSMDLSAVPPDEPVTRAVGSGGDGCVAGLSADPGPVSESSAHGAEMLIRLKEGVGYVYPVPQGYVAEMAQADEVRQGVKLLSEHPVNEGIENGSGTFSHNSVAVQVNDYEIERRSGILPARRRLIPFKFRDFQDPEDILGEDVDDEDYDPEEAQSIKRPRKTTPRPGVRGVGRPRKVRKDHAYDRAGLVKDDQAVVAGGEGPPGGEDSPEKKKLKKADRPFPRRGRPPNDDPLHQPKIFKCLQCDKKFSLKGNLKVHMRTHTDERPFKCELAECGKSFRSNESLRRHNLSHQGIKLFGCDICANRFSSNVALKEHMARHTYTKDQICPVCSRAFRQLSCLRRHMTTHTSDLPHHCTMCEKRFSQAVYLRSHMRSHTGERPYRCDTCGKTFSHQSDKMRHMTIHLGTKPYVCEVCEARFSDPSTRRRHVREHSGFKPYTCQLCGDNFKRSGQLKAHLNKKHTNCKDDVLITKQGAFNSLQFQFKGSKNAEVPEQLHTEQVAASDRAQYVQQVATPGDTVEGQVITLATGQEQVQLIDENGHIQHVQVQQQHPDPDSETAENQAVLGHIQQQLVQAGFSQSQLDGNHIILTQTNSTSQSELMEETQKIIQQIQSQFEPTGDGQTGVAGSQQIMVAYQILHDDDNQQIVEIQYHPVEVEEVEGVVEQQAVLTAEGQEEGEQAVVEQQQVEQRHIESGNVKQEHRTVVLVESPSHLEQNQQIEQSEPMEQHHIEQREIEQQQIEQQQREWELRQQQLEQQQIEQRQLEQQQIEQQQIEQQQIEQQQIEQQQIKQQQIEQQQIEQQQIEQQQIEQQQLRQQQIEQQQLEQQQIEQQQIEQHQLEQQQIEQQQLEQQQVEQQQLEQQHIQQQLEQQQIQQQHLEQQQIQQQPLEQQQIQQQQLEQQQIEQQQLEQQQIEQQQLRQQQLEQKQIEQQQIQQPQQQERVVHVVDDVPEDIEPEVPSTETYHSVAETCHERKGLKEPCQLKSEVVQNVVEGIASGQAESNPSSLELSSESALPSGRVREEAHVKVPDEQRLHPAEHEGRIEYAEPNDRVVESIVEEQKGVDSGEATATLLTLQNLDQQQQQASVDYVTNPDFNCQEYYNWLSSFTELCKLVPMPLDVDLFQKISQVHKTLSDVLATPRGILTNRENFKTLMNISKELNGIINEHLTFVLQNLDTDIDLE